MMRLYACAIVLLLSAATLELTGDGGKTFAVIAVCSLAAAMVVQFREHWRWWRRRSLGD